MLCPHCGNDLGHRPDLAGQTFSCNYCNGPFTYVSPIPPPVLATSWPAPAVRSTAQPRATKNPLSFGWILAACAVLITGIAGAWISTSKPSAGLPSVAPVNAPAIDDDIVIEGSGLPRTKAEVLTSLQGGGIILEPLELPALGRGETGYRIKSIPAVIVFTKQGETLRAVEYRELLDPLGMPPNRDLGSVVSVGMRVTGMSVDQTFSGVGGAISRLEEGPTGIGYIQIGPTELIVVEATQQPNGCRSFKFTAETKSDD